MRAIIATVAGALALAGCAPTGSPGDGMVSGSAPRPCFSPHQVRSFSQGPSQTVYLKTQRDDVYEIQSIGFCRELEFTHSLGITAQGGVGRLCIGDFAVVTVPELGERPSACRVRVVKQLTPDEIAALPDRQRP